jgi:hypothetical protein
VLAHGEVVRTHTPGFDVQRPSAAAGTLDAFLGAFPDGRLALAWLAASRGPETRSSRTRWSSDFSRRMAPSKRCSVTWRV